LRALPIPVIGRIEAGRVLLDLRCLEDETAFLAQLGVISKMLDQRSAPFETAAARRPQEEGIF
jgi:hypothetical protein